jgi:hypothetical protein
MEMPLLKVAVGLARISKFNGHAGKTLLLPRYKKSEKLFFLFWTSSAYVATSLSDKRMMRIPNLQARTSIYIQ